MKNALIFLFLNIISSVAYSGVIAYWRFEEVERINDGHGRPFSLDEAGNYGIYDPTLNSDVPTTVIPATGDENIYSSGGGYIGLEFGSETLVLGGQFTVECYYKLDNIQRYASIFAFGGRFQTYGLGVGIMHEPETDEEGTVRFGVSFNDGERYLSDSMNFLFGEWFHFALVKNDDWFGLYINGELWWNVEDNLNDYYAWGNWNDDVMNIGGWGSYIDEFRISNEALSPKDFLNYYAAVPEPGTLALLALGSGVLALRRRKWIS